MTRLPEVATSLQAGVSVSGGEFGRFTPHQFKIRLSLFLFNADVVELVDTQA